MGPAIKQDVSGDVNRHLAPASGVIMASINDFIAGYRLGPDSYADRLRQSGFFQTLYQVFQVFKQALDSFIAEHINPEIIRFIAAQEARICERLDSIAAPYKSLIEDAYSEFCSLMERFGIRIDGRGSEAVAIPDAARLLRTTGVSHAPLASSINYTARLRTEAVLRRGFYRVVGGVKKALKKPVQAGEEDVRALREGLVRIRRETVQSLGLELKDYRENLKFKYFFVQIELAAHRLAEAVGEQLQAYAADFGALAQGVNARQEDKTRAAAVLAGMADDCRAVQEAIDRLKRDIAAAVP